MPEHTAWWAEPALESLTNNETIQDNFGIDFVRRAKGYDGIKMSRRGGEGSTERTTSRKRAELRLGQQDSDNTGEVYHAENRQGQGRGNPLTSVPSCSENPTNPINQAALRSLLTVTHDQRTAEPTTKILQAVHKNDARFELLFGLSIKERRRKVSGVEESVRWEREWM